MSILNDQVDVVVSAPAPEAESLEFPEVFIIDGIEYQVEPDNPGKVQDHRGFYYRRESGFGGREFVIVTNSGRRIVTHNLWMGEETDDPDTASFEGPAAKPVRLRREPRFEKGGYNG